MVKVDLYGGRRGLVEHLRARALYALGAYSGVCDIDWRDVGRLAFVCQGNICRSPYASARARALGVAAASFGLDAMEGAPADQVATKHARLRGLDLTEHRSARIESSRIADGDLIIVFEPWQLAEALRRCANPTPASLLGIWAKPIRPHIQDPYERSDSYFQQCFSVIDANVAEIVRRMNTARTSVSPEKSADRTPESTGQGCLRNGTVV